MRAPPRRLRACVDAWPACEPDAYHPRCCRWPKPCSCTTYDPLAVDDALLEPDLSPTDWSEGTPPRFRHLRGTTCGAFGAHLQVHDGGPCVCDRPPDHDGKHSCATCPATWRTFIIRPGSVTRA